MRPATTLGGLDLHVVQVEDARITRLVGSCSEERRVEPRLGGFDRDLVRGARVELGEERIAVVGFSCTIARVAEARVERVRPADAVEARVSIASTRVLARVVGPRLEVRLVDLTTSAPAAHEVAQLLVDRVRVGERERAQVG